MRNTHLRIPEVTAAALISTIVLLVAVTPALLAAPAGGKPTWNPAGRASAALLAPAPAEVREA